METAWDRCWPFLEPTVELAGTHGREDVEAMIQTGRWQFWPGREAAVITAVIRHPLLAECQIVFAGGKLAELIEMEKSINTWAQAQGCSRMLIAGRPGWERVLGGYSRNFAVLIKEISIASHSGVTARP
ncbi:hypothetical protein GGE65_007734 [Skermanella aerolata]